jgi:RNA polymerase sigma factor (sigma-70 family)
MTGGPSVCYLREIQTLFETGTAGGLSDRQLLERFVSGRDAAAEAAFEVLVMRHGPMVLRVCRNVLTDPTDAEDAFQATFLVLVRRCRSIRRLESLGSWLYGVALRVAAAARRDVARRRAAERRGGLRIMAAIDPVSRGELDPGEFGPAIQQEVQRLPEKYRAVVVLCYWQGLNQEQAAARLGCPLGTVRSRLARARDLLHRRLKSRGLAPLAGIVLAALDRGSSSAAVSAEASRLSPVPFQLAQSTIRAAGRVAAGRATEQVASTVVATLVQRVLWSLAMIKINGLLLGVVVLGLVGYGAEVAIGKAKGARPIPAPAPRSAGRPAANDRVVDDQAKTGDEAQTAGGNARGPGDSKVFSKVYSSAPGTIISIRRSHSNVKKGEVICELDSTPLQDQLVNQQIKMLSAKANYENATLMRENAEIAVVEYQDGVFKMQEREAAGDIKIAEAELALAQDALKADKATAEKAPDAVGSLEIKRAELAVLRAGIGLEKAQTRHKLLRDFSGPANTKKLKADVQKTHSDELAKKAILDLETEKARKLERMIIACKILAPRDGRLEYSFEGIGEQMVVQERQLLFTIISPSLPPPKAR